MVIMQVNVWFPLSFWKWLTEPSPLSPLFLAQRTTVVQEPELGTTGPDALYAPLQLKLIKIIKFIDSFLFIKKIINFIAEKLPIISIILPQNTINKPWIYHNMKYVYSVPSVLCEQISVPWATSHLMIRKRSPTLFVKVCTALVLYISP